MGEELDLYTTESVFRLWESFPTVEHTSVYSIPYRVITPTKNPITVLCALLPNLFALKHLPSQPDMSPTPLTLSVVVYKCNLKNQRVNGYTKIVKEEGTAALFKGAGANALRTVGAALVLVLYS